MAKKEIIYAYVAKKEKKLCTPTDYSELKRIDRIQWVQVTLHLTRKLEIDDKIISWNLSESKFTSFYFDNKF